jgi:hypothetical protein
MLRFQDIKHNKINNFKQIEEIQLAKSQVGFNKSPNHQIYERLHSEELRKVKNTTGEPSTRRMISKKSISPKG